MSGRYALAAARPKRFRPRDELRREVVQVALELFLRHGVERTNLNTIALRADVSKPTIYEVFTCKQSLLDAVFVEAVKDADVSWISAATQTQTHFSDFLDQTCNQYKRLMSSPGGTDGFVLVLREGAYSASLISSFSKVVAEPLSSAIQCVIERAIERGECKKMNTRVIQKLIFAPMHFILSERAIFGARAMSTETACAYLEENFKALKMNLCNNDGRGQSSNGNETNRQQ